jgi:glycerophosphoryl diester phosphodiesterase
MWTDLEPPIVIAHRGDRAYAPENTLAAFKQAAEKGADAVEFDVKLSADGQVIVLHDQTVNRTTNGKGNVAKLPFEALKELDASEQFPGKFLNERIPSLEEVFETLGKKIYMNIELTNYSTPNDPLVTKVVDLVKQHGMGNQVLFSSFIPKNLRKAHSLMPDVPCGLLSLPGLMGLWSRSIGYLGDYETLNPFFTDINSKLVTRVHSAGKQINAWTVNAVADLNRIIGLSVDGIISDDPMLVLQLLGRAN